MTRGRYFLLWAEMFLRGVITLALLHGLLNWGLSGKMDLLSSEYLFSLMVTIPIFSAVMLPFIVNFVVTARWTFLRCILLALIFAMIIPAIKIIGGLMGAVRGGWWPDMNILINHIGAGILYGLLAGSLFWGLGVLFPWRWRVLKSES